jgi:peptide-methionine (R)-S-oxide reductase
VLNRRRWLAASARGVTGMLVWRYGHLVPQAAAAGGADSPKIVSIVDFSDAGARLGVTKVPMIVKASHEWQRQLTPLAFAVTRRGETERPFTGPYWNLRDKGLYRCICCATALFNSDRKFESGTGWPSFWAPLAKENVREHADYRFGMSRIAVSCRRCDAHLGHVFDDGPDPTGLRYCMNSASLQFIKA